MQDETPPLRAGTTATFDWRVWADATCAGPTLLVPIPLLDLALDYNHLYARWPDETRTPGQEAAMPLTSDEERR